MAGTPTPMLPAPNLRCRGLDIPTHAFVVIDVVSGRFVVPDSTSPAGFRLSARTPAAIFNSRAMAETAKRYAERDVSVDCAVRTA